MQWEGPGAAKEAPTGLEVWLLVRCSWYTPLILPCERQMQAYLWVRSCLRKEREKGRKRERKDRKRERKRKNKREEKLCVASYWRMVVSPSVSDSPSTLNKLSLVSTTIMGAEGGECWGDPHIESCILDLTYSRHTFWQQNSLQTSSMYLAHEATVSHPSTEIP